ncbi:uncharacterized protein LOC122246502 [Penaeus japonicus]|uniref:uncharacterized protein LOC122246502 n=1 Tax=Penaeus japonicus TaxID=27405 RepID=UPI001C710CE3|nr:uncharacterized protein LOC122246502 [Penaeus japonicus]
MYLYGSETSICHSASTVAMKLLVLLSLAAFAWAQDRPECMCGAFISTNNAEYEIHRLPPIDTDNCQEEKKCAILCAAEWVRLTDDGNLDYVMDNGVTVGQESCRAMAAHGHPNLPPHDVYAYYNICHGPWMFDGKTSQQQLCCVDGTYPGDCDSFTRPPLE